MDVLGLCCGVGVLCADVARVVWGCNASVAICLTVYRMAWVMSG